MNWLKNVGLFFASPFIALAYVIALPFVGFYQFVKLGREAFTKNYITELPSATNGSENTASSP